MCTCVPVVLEVLFLLLLLLNCRTGGGSCPYVSCSNLVADRSKIAGCTASLAGKDTAARLVSSVSYLVISVVSLMIFLNISRIDLK